MSSEDFDHTGFDAGGEDVPLPGDATGDYGDPVYQRRDGSTPSVVTIAAPSGDPLIDALSQTD